MTVLKYIFLNPVRARIVKRAEDYLYSTLYFWDHDHDPIKIDQNYLRNLFDQFHSKEDLLDWINQGFIKDQEEALTKGFRNKIFKPGVNKTRRSKILFDLGRAEFS